jgi:hypothetical protein
LKDGRIDAFFWVGGLPTAAVTDVGAAPNVKIALVDTADIVDKMNAKYSPIYSRGVIPAKTYPGQDKDNAVAVVQDILVANANMPDDVTYAIVKTLMEKKPELVAVHREAENFKVESQTAGNSPLPFHPGAAKSSRRRAQSSDTPVVVMAGLVPAIHALREERKTRMPGTKPGMTNYRGPLR